jgi:hypothetical protein
MGRIYKFLIIVGFLASSHIAQASSSPFGLAVVPGIQYPADDYILMGMRIGVLWGNQAEMYGLDLGVLGNVTQAAFGGTAISGIFNINKGTANVWGLQFAGIGNFNLGQTDVHGVQASLLMNYNPADASIHGLSIAPLNLGAGTKVYGLQVGVFNQADTVYGLQIGLINVAKTLHGVQIGFLNFHETGLFQVSPVLNIGF